MGHRAIEVSGNTLSRMLRGWRSLAGPATCAVLFACGASSETSPADTATAGPTTSGSGGASAGGGGASATTATSGVGGGLGMGGFSPIPVRTLPLDSITFWERSGGEAPTDYTFAINGPELTAKLADPMTDASHDIKGVSTEYYDVYYSDADGVFDIDGSYLTISGVFEHALPAGGGLNLAEIGLNYTDATTEYGNYVASYVVLGDNQVEANVALCIDNDLQTHTTMGNTVGQTDRLRVTLGFESTSGPPPE